VLRDHLRRAAAAIAAANDEDLLRLSGDDTAEGRPAHRLGLAGRLPGPREPVDWTNPWHLWARPAADGV
jgi:hypothetical protein